MKVSELIEHLETVQEEHGDYDVGATCDGWVPSEIAVEVNDTYESCMLFGCRSVTDREFEYNDHTIVNSEK